jgi:putative sterol carrier protein|tara:strand:+ start:214 stop:555 length:342 start_codon:yes stop_codon:yes gene_type:complete
MTREECANQLERLFQGSAAESTDIVICLSIYPIKADESITYHISSGSIIRDPSIAVNATFFFTSWDQLLEIVTGVRDPINAFMKGEFRADGHLTSVFLLLSIFSRPTLLRTPQ